MFLSATERDRLKLLNPPEDTPGLFEKYLPFALALDLEQQWSERFAGVLARAAQSPDTRYSPAWYSGRGWSASHPAGFAAALNAMSSSISSAATPPGSSSGSSGGGSSGGSSGGGGGGGGGGGW
jgi:uncharacterized membrane protein